MLGKTRENFTERSITLDILVDDNLVDKKITEFAYYKKGWGLFQCGAAPIVRYGIDQFIGASNIAHS